METEQTSTTNTESPSTVKFTLTFKKQTFPMDRPLDEKLGDFRQIIAKDTGVAAGLQKLMLKGLMKDDSKTLRELGVKDGVKIMLVGSSIEDVMNTAAPPPPSDSKEDKVEEASKEPLSEQLPHKKIIDKGLPEGAELGKKGKNESLPAAPLQNIYNNVGVKVRLTFKMFTQELWISSASSTQKLPFSSIRAVSSEPIKGKEEYHIVSLQLGASQTSKYYLYFVPCQYTKAIRTAIMSDFTGGY